VDNHTLFISVLLLPAHLPKKGEKGGNKRKGVVDGEIGGEEARYSGVFNYYLTY